MKGAGRLLAKIHARGLRTFVDHNGDLRLRGPRERITPKLVSLIEKHAEGLLELLKPDCERQPLGA